MCAPPHTVCAVSRAARRRPSSPRHACRELRRFRRPDRTFSCLNWPIARSQAPSAAVDCLLTEADPPPRRTQTMTAGSPTSLEQPPLVLAHDDAAACRNAACRRADFGRGDAARNIPSHDRAAPLRRARRAPADRSGDESRPRAGGGTRRGPALGVRGGGAPVTDWPPGAPLGDARAPRSR